MMSQPTMEMWQVHANGKTFDTDIVEMTQWIGEGVLLREDKVRKGNLRWIEAGKVPALIAVFNAKDHGEPLPTPVVTTTRLDPQDLPGGDNPDPVNLTAGRVEATTYTPTNPVDPTTSDRSVCSVHADVEAAFSCDTCFSLFCKACPTSYGGTVKICPMCGAMCSPLVKQPTVVNPSFVYYGTREKFGFSDFGNALTYPFRFKASLIIGAVMYMFFSVGQSVAGFGGIFMIAPAIICFMLANCLVFGVLSNTVGNFTQGKIGENFMPSFEDFSIWDEVVHPFFLSIGVYLSSFGPLIAVCLLAFFLAAGAVSKEMNAIESDAVQTVNPELPYAAKAAKQSEEIKALVKKQGDAQKKRVEAYSSSIESGEDAEIEPAPTVDGAAIQAAEDREIERINQMIQDSGKAQLEATVGKAPDTKAKEQSELIKQILAYGALFLLLGGICLAWGVFYFPAACAVAGYTGSFAATMNPAVGLDTIRRLGLDYLKILLMAVALVLISGFITGIISSVLSPFDMPGLGNVPAKALGSMVGFYFSVVFSCVLGFALYKAANRLNLFT